MSILASWLALGSLVLQVLLVSLGGRLCFRTSPFAGQTHCEAGCCAAHDQDDSRTFVAEGAHLPLMPAECCIERIPDYPAHSAAERDLPPCASLKSPASHPRVEQDLPGDAARGAAGRYTPPLPPPALRALRVTVLRI